jgi:hypothetical protein
LLTGAARARRYLGQINPTDFFTRLLAGIVYTRLAPASFYKDPSGPDRHFDGMCAAPRAGPGRAPAGLPACGMLASGVFVARSPCLCVERRECRSYRHMSLERMRVGILWVEALT